jgi:iron(III) transport system substrate-binding protein
MRLTLLAVAILFAAACAPAAGPSASAPAASGNAPAANPARGSAAPQRSPEVERLIAAAQAAGETELNLSWAEDNLGGHEGATKLGDLFNRMYGLNAKVTFTPGRLDQLVGRVTQEIAAGRRASLDLFLGGETHIGPLLQQDALESYDYTALSPRITPDLLAPQQSAVTVGSRIAGISYNPNLVTGADLPKRLEDVLAPKWKGIIASTQTAIGFDRVAYRPEWTPDRMRGFVNRLSDQVGGLVRGGEQERVASGEFAMLVLNTGSQEVHKLRARGAPLAQVIPDDGSIVIYHYLAVPRHSVRPNLAKLFVNTVLSEEGQRLLYETAYYDLHKLPDSRTATELAEVRARGISPLEIDVQFYLEHPDVGPLRDELIKVLVERHGG